MRRARPPTTARTAAEGHSLLSQIDIRHRMDILWIHIVPAEQVTTLQFKMEAAQQRLDEAGDAGTPSVAMPAPPEASGLAKTTGYREKQTQKTNTIFSQRKSVDSCPKKQNSARVGSQSSTATQITKRIE